MTRIADNLVEQLNMLKSYIRENSYETFAQVKAAILEEELENG
jgi:hypothetical protein